MTVNRVTKNFLDIVQIDSPTGHEQNISKYLIETFKQLGVSCSADELGNLFCNIRGDDSKETYLLNAHIDTVEPGRGIKPIIKDDGYIVSSGDTILGADNKSAVAVLMEVIARLVESNQKTNHPLEIVFTVSEESGNVGATGLDYSKIKSKFGWSSDASNRNLGDIILSSPFYNRFDIQIMGKSAHASKPDLAVNVVPIFSSAVSNLKLGKIDEQTLVNIGIVNAGVVVNTIPGTMTVSGEVRSPDESKVESEAKKVCEAFATAAESMGAKIESKIVRENAGFVFDKDESHVKKTLDVLSKHQISPDLIQSWGCYDANVFAEHGIKILNIADGSKNSHTSEETVNINDLEKMVLIFLDLIQ